MPLPNPEIWGDSSTWFYSTLANGLTSTLAVNLNAQKPKCENFDGPDNIYKSSLYRAVSRRRLILNDYIDDTLCPCGQSPDISPFAKIAIFNENNDLSLTPRLCTITDSNINWFLADFVENDTNAYFYHELYSSTDTNIRTLSLEQFAPKANTNLNLDNPCMALSPYTYYGIRSFVLSIEVKIMPADNESPARGTEWVSLDTWKSTYPTYVCLGMRLFVRNCININSDNLQLTYSNTHDNPASGYSACLAVTNPIPIINNGSLTDTQLLSIFSGGVNSRCIYIFDNTPIIYNSNSNARRRAILPAWDYFDGQTINSYWYPSSDPMRYFFYKIPYNQANYDKMMSIAALFGCYFTPTNKYTFGYDMLDNDLYLPVLDNNGVTHGQYTHGTDNANNPLYNLNSIFDWQPSSGFKIYIGDNQVRKIYVGNKEVETAYLGNNEL